MRYCIFLDGHSVHSLKMTVASVTENRYMKWSPSLVDRSRTLLLITHHVLHIGISSPALKSHGGDAEQPTWMLHTWWVCVTAKEL